MGVLCRSVGVRSQSSHSAEPNFGIVGGRIWVSLSEKNKSVFAVADQSSHNLVHLKGTPHRSQQLPLEPWGYLGAGRGVRGRRAEAPRTGRLSIHDARTGRIVEEVFAPRILDLFYRGIAPTEVVLSKTWRRKRSSIGALPSRLLRSWWYVVQIAQGQRSSSRSGTLDGEPPL
jgi:hypothetical protein